MATTRGTGRQTAHGKQTDLTPRKPDSARGTEGRRSTKAGRNMGDQRTGGSANKRPDIEGATGDLRRTPVGKDRSNATTRKAKKTRADAASRSDAFDRDLHQDRSRRVDRSDNRTGALGQAGKSPARSGRRSHRSKGQLGK